MQRPMPRLDPLPSGVRQISDRIEDWSNEFFIGYEARAKVIGQPMIQIGGLCCFAAF